LLVMCLCGRGFMVNAYAEIIATRPLGMMVYYCIPMDD
jgi:hypothetical protein